MKRTLKKNNTTIGEVFDLPSNILGFKTDAILSGDWHLREDTPICREDDFEESLWVKVRYIKTLQKALDCPVLCSGDLFHHWKPSPGLLSKCIDNLPKEFYTIYGNHDLPQHNLDLDHKSGLYTLEKAGSIRVLKSGHWGQPIDENSGIEIKGRKILIQHVMTYDKTIPYPGCVDLNGKRLARKYADWNLVLTGHNHQSFVIKRKNNILVNPGSISRQEAGQIDFKPKVYLWNAENNEVLPVELPIKTGVITREHIEEKENRENRIQAFISKLDGEWEDSVNFEKNLENFLKVNEVRDSVKKIIYKSI